MERAVPTLSRSRVRPLAALGTLVAAGLLALGLVPVFASASPSVATGEGIEPEPALPAVAAAVPVPEPAEAPAPVPVAEPEPEPAPAPAEPPREPEPFLTVRVAGDVVNLRSRPGGRIVTRLGKTTEFGSPRSLSVVERRGRWLGVVAPELGNGEIAWIDSRGSGVRLGATSMSVSIDLSRRLLVVKRDDEVVRRITIGVGAPGSPTPIGRFAVTDKLPGSRYGPFYGCCILALSAKQPNLPPGWTGGDRIAVHGTDDPATVGQATSAGCPHARDADMRYLLRVLPLGTPVFVHP
jgi:lipoprotein-anchoring transpeptidase ErfK/SrfK